MHIFLEKWNVMSIVKPFYLINLIRLITFLGFQDNDIRSLTRHGRGLGGRGGIYIVERLWMWKLHLKSNPLTLLNLYTIIPFIPRLGHFTNQTDRISFPFIYCNLRKSLPFQIPHCCTKLPFSGGAIIDWSLLEGPCWVVLTYPHTDPTKDVIRESGVRKASSCTWDKKSAM